MEFIKNNWIKAPVLLYVIGFIVHNTYLVTFGSYEFELVQAKYILSGFGVVAFSAMCFAFLLIKVNISYIFDSFNIDKLTPWMLRAVALPAIIYSYLYGITPEEQLSSKYIFVHLNSLFFLLANFVVMFSIADLIFLFSEGKTIRARLIRSFLRVLSIPMVLGTFVIAWFNPDFSAVVKSTMFFFFGLIGIGLNQEDKRHGVKLNYSDEKTKEEHQNLYVIFIGIIAIAFLLWMVISNYVASIYPKLPVALGGAQIRSVEIHLDKNNRIDSDLIQETSNWLLYRNNKTGNIERLKTSLVHKIIYVDAFENTPNNTP